MSEWKEVSLSEMGKTITGKTPSSQYPEDFGDEIPFITPSDSFEKKYINKSERFLSRSGSDRLKEKIISPNSIMVTCIGSAMGKVVKNTLPSVTNQQINSIIVNESFDSDYIYYLLKNNYAVLRNAASGSTAIPILNKTDFDNLRFKVELDLNEQRKMVSILSTIDDKIETNHQINQELESMAKILYDYWFVQFDFPDQNGKPYKSSGGKMIYNPELKREIPEGWGVEKISEFLVLNKDKYNKELNWQKIHYLETSNLIENKIEKLKKLDIKSDKIPSRAKEIVKDRDILYSLVRPNQMHFGFIRNPIQNLVASTGFVLLSCEDNPIYNIFFYLFMTLPNNVRRMIKLSESSTSSYPSIRPEDILNMEIVTPYDFSNYRSLVEYLDKIYYQIDVLYKQNEALIQLRDWLLPMLMNGQVKVER